MNIKHWRYCSFIIELFLLILFFIGVNSSYSQIQNTEISLYIPTGEYIIGTTDVYLTDSSRIETLSRKKNDFRRIYIKIWYPADSIYSIEPEKYLENYDTAFLLKTFKPLGINGEMLSNFLNIKTNSYKNIPVSHKEEKYPVLIFSQGFYFGFPELYTFYMENLASHGYIVCSITHPYEQPIVVFPDGDIALLRKKKCQLHFLQWKLADLMQFRQPKTDKKIKIITTNYLKRMKNFDKSLDLWVDDTKFFVEYLESIKNTDALIFSKLLDLENIGVFGQSFGGAVAGQLCLIDKRFKAGINIDCFQFGDVIEHDIGVPFMLIQSKQHPKWIIGNNYIYSQITAPFYSLLIFNSKHYATTDVSVLLGNSDYSMEYIGEIDGFKTINTINKYILDFFNLYLKNKPSILINKCVNNNHYIFNSKNN